MYVGGAFTTVGGQPRSSIAALDATTGIATAWNPGANNEVGALAAAGNTVYAGGAFTSIGGQPHNRIAALDASTGLATAWNPNANGSVQALVASGSTVYAGGSFSSVGGQSRNFIAAINAATGQATAWNPNANSSVQALAVGGSTVYAGGSFSTIGGQSRSRIAELDATTGLATAWNPDAGGATPGVHALSTTGSTVYAGGDFTTIGGQPRNNLAALDVTSGLATAWNPGANARVSALSANGSTVYAAGSFTTVGGQPRNRIAALDALTGLATVWNPDANDQVLTLALGEAAVYAGGLFSEIGGAPRSGLSALGAGEGVPLLSIGDVSIQEGDAGPSDAVLTITLTGRTSSIVTVDYQTFEGTATLANGDFAATSGTATIDPKTLTGTITVPVNGDVIQEGNETFTVRLSNATNAALVDSSGTCTIVNDDGMPDLSINDVAVAEGSSGPTDFVFTVKLSHPTDQPVSVHYRTYDGSATVADNDYVLLDGTASIPAKSDSTTLTVSVTGDLTVELWDEFTVVLDSSVNAVISDSSGIGTIINDDGAVGVTDLPAAFALRAGAPNPFSRSTVIGFDLPRPAAVWLRVYDVRGRLVRTIADGSEWPAGRHVAVWDASTLAGRNAAPGIYFYEMVAPGFRSVRRLVLVR